MTILKDPASAQQQHSQQPYIHLKTELKKMRKKKKKGQSSAPANFQTILLFADLGGFHNNDDHNRRNEDLTKYGDWTTENIICNRRAYEPLLMAFTESLAQMILTLMSDHR